MEHEIVVPAAASASAAGSGFVAATVGGPVSCEHGAGDGTGASFPELVCQVCQSCSSQGQFNAIFARGIHFTPVITSPRLCDLSSELLTELYFGRLMAFLLRAS